MNYAEFEEKFYKEILPNKHKDCRNGQTLMNFLADIRLPKYKEITATSFDCFYNDNLIKDCLDYLKSNWNNFYKDIKKVFYSVKNEYEEKCFECYLTGDVDVNLYYINNEDLVFIKELKIHIDDNIEDKVKSYLISIGFDKNVTLIKI